MTSPISLCPALQTDASDTDRDGAPLTWICLSTISRSSGLASSWPAAMRRIWFRASSAASLTALPATSIERLPTVPASQGLASVSTFSTVTSSVGMPNTSATIMGMPNRGAVP